MITSIKNIKDLISQGKVGKSIDMLTFIAKQTDYYNSAVLISSRFEQYSLSEINGTDNNKIEKNKLINSILQLCDKISKEYPNNQETINGKPIKTSKKIEYIETESAFNHNSNNNNLFQELIGFQINNYVITEYIHSGGFGSVFKAKHKHLNNIYAIKISHEVESGFDLLDEILSLGITGLQVLNHDYIVKTYDIGKIIINGSMRIFIVMEFIDGGDLDKISRTNLSVKEIWDRIDIFNKICQGIYYSHTIKYKNKFGFQVVGLMHGDIKPANILITQKRIPKIMDFMFVDMTKLIEIKVNIPQEIQYPDCLTQTFGTLGYMPDEQENHGIVTERTDIYALGILLFEILCPDKFSNCKFNKKQQIHSYLTNYNKKIPQFISDIIFIATKENADDRYNSVQDIIKIISKNSTWFKKILN